MEVLVSDTKDADTSDVEEPFCFPSVDGSASAAVETTDVGEISLISDDDSLEAICINDDRLGVENAEFGVGDLLDERFGVVCTEDEDLPRVKVEYERESSCMTALKVRAKAATRPGVDEHSFSLLLGDEKAAELRPVGVAARGVTVPESL